MNPVVLQAENITKNFRAFRAQGSALTCGAGEIPRALRRKRRGKSTLIKLISGIYPSVHTTEIFFVHDSLRNFVRRGRQSAGIAVIYQELALVNDMTVGEKYFSRLGAAHATSFDRLAQGLS